MSDRVWIESPLVQARDQSLFDGRGSPVCFRACNDRGPMMAQRNDVLNRLDDAPFISDGNVADRDFVFNVAEPAGPLT